MCNELNKKDYKKDYKKAISLLNKVLMLDLTPIDQKNLMKVKRQLLTTFKQLNR